VIVSVAAFGGALLWMVSPATNFITAFVCGLLGTIYFAIYGKDLRTGAQSKPTQGLMGLNKSINASVGRERI